MGPRGTSAFPGRRRRVGAPSGHDKEWVWAQSKGAQSKERNPRGQTLHIAQIRFSFIASPSRPSDDSKLLQRSWKRWPVSFRKRLNRRAKVACSHVTPSTKFACGVSNRQVIVIRHQAPSYSKRSLRAMVSSPNGFPSLCNVQSLTPWI